MKIDKWLSNLPIGKRLLLLFSVNVSFWIALCTLGALFMRKIHGIVTVPSLPHAQILETNRLFVEYVVIVLVFSLVFILLLLYLTFFIIKSIVVPIEMLSRSAVLISEGVIEGSLSSNRKDELGQLARDMDRILKVLQNLCADLRDLSEKHNIAGDIYAKVDSSKYSGEYKETIDLLNGMIWQYIADARDVLFCINEYTLGNFNTQIRTFPGARAAANNISYGLRQSLVSLTKAVSDAVEAAAGGNFEIKLNEGQFHGDWKQLATQINQMLENLATPIRETTDAMLEIYEGNLNPNIRGEFIGDFALIKTSVSNAIENVSHNIREITEAIDAFGAGNTEFTLKGDFSGDYAGIKHALEELNKSMKKNASVLSETSGRIAVCAEQIEQIREEAPNDSAGDIVKEDDKALSAIEDFGSYFQNFGKIVTIIENTSYHANLIAHSASVEIARAGENGQYFSFIVEELGSLAEMNGEAIAEAQVFFEDAQKRLESCEACLKNIMVNESKRESRELQQFLTLLDGVSNISGDLMECVNTLNSLHNCNSSDL